MMVVVYSLKGNSDDGSDVQSEPKQPSGQHSSCRCGRGCVAGCVFPVDVGHGDTLNAVSLADGCPGGKASAARSTDLGSIRAFALDLSHGRAIPLT